MRCPAVLAFAPLLLAVVPLAAQSNTIPGLGSRLADLSGLQSFGRIGTFPNGRNGIAAGVTVCNNGTVNINWLQEMNPDHPFYAFILCRESNGRFSQVSDWSYCKHGFASINSDCGGCVQPPGGGTQLGVRCGDTYGAGLNSDRYDLGPPSEIDPWLLTWTPRGSHFDRGEPDVGTPQNQDSVRSLTFAMTSAMDGVKHRIEVDDQDLNVAGATYFLGGRVMTKGETEATREDNMLSRRYTPSWNGAQWSFSPIGATTSGTPLNQWAGATLRFGTNGTTDGRVWIGAKVSQLTNGLWHYEYAFHNRDNSRGIAGFRLPKCPTARIFAAGFRDLDRSPLNDWVVTDNGGEVSVLASAGNALEWNTIYNVWFDSDAAPAGGTVTLDEARIAPGPLQFTVLDVPSPVKLQSEFLGAGCGAPAPQLYSTGSPALPTIPNATFGVRMQAQPSTGVLVVLNAQLVNVPIGGCTQFVGLPGALSMGLQITDGSGLASYPLAIPNNPVFEGTDLVLQGIEVAAGGPLFGQFNASNGLRLRIGSNRAGCP